VECGVEEEGREVGQETSKVIRTQGTTELRYDGTKFDPNAFERIDLLTSLTRTLVEDGNKPDRKEPRFEHVIWDGSPRTTVFGDTVNPSEFL
jgi:hypothetical protein